MSAKVGKERSIKIFTYSLHGIEVENQLATSREPSKNRLEFFLGPAPFETGDKQKAFIKLKFNTIFDASYAALMFSLSMPSKIISCLKAMFCSSPCILEVIVLRFRDQGIDGSEASVWDEEGKNMNKKKSRKSSQRASSCFFCCPRRLSHSSFSLGNQQFATSFYVLFDRFVRFVGHYDGKNIVVGVISSGRGEL